MLSGVKGLKTTEVILPEDGYFYDLGTNQEIGYPLFLFLLCGTEWSKIDSKWGRVGREISSKFLAETPQKTIC